MSKARERIKTKIAALRAKTRASGCTEAEALAAAELAAELMARHGIDADDLEITEEVSPEPTQGLAAWRADLVATIAWCTMTAAMHGPDGWHFVGREPGPDIAVYLREVTFRAVQTGVSTFKTSTHYKRRRSLRTKRNAVEEYRAGFVRTLRERLRELFGPRVDAIALQAAKDALGRMYSEKTDLVPRRRDVQLGNAYWDGRKDGRSVDLNRGVRADRAPELIGRGS